MNNSASPRCAVDAVGGEALGLLDGLLRLPLGPGNDLVVIGARLIDQLLPFLLRLIDFCGDTPPATAEYRTVTRIVAESPAVSGRAKFVRNVAGSGS